MNNACENDVNYHDTDAVPYTAAPDPEKSDAFQYWKSNIKGVDLHYSMYTEWMLDVWKTGTWYYSSQESHFTAPSWQNFAGNNVTNGIKLSAENRALYDYINKIQPNFFVSYHSASNIVQWNYGYGKMENGEALRAAARDISEKCGELLNFSVSSGSNPHIGHPGWFMKNSERYLDTCGYGVTIELASRQYLSGVAEYGDGYMDAPPTKVIQLTDDVMTTDGKMHYSLWTTGKFFPVALAQYIMDNRLVEEGAPLAEDPSPKLYQTPGMVTILPPKEIPLLPDNGPAAPDVTTSAATITLDGKALPVDAFLIEGYHYFRLRDLAMMMTGTEKELSVGWDGKTKTIALMQPGTYTPTGDELKAMVKSGTYHAKKVYPTLIFNGAAVNLPAYNIEGYHYYRLRDLAKVLSFDVDWDGNTKTVFIDTTPKQNGDMIVIPGKSYTRSVNTEVSSIFSQPVDDPSEIELTVRGRKLNNVQLFGTFRPVLASQAFVTAADILPSTALPQLYNTEYQFMRPQAYIGAKTLIRFTYRNSSAETVYCTFTAARNIPISVICGIPVKMIDLPQTDTCSAAAPTMLAGQGEKNTITLRKHRTTISPADINTDGNYTVVLYGDSTYTGEVSETALSVGANTVYACAFDAGTGDRAYYSFTVVNPALNNDAGIWEIASGGIQRSWTLSEHAGTKEDPDVLEVRINGTLFGGASVRKLTAFAETRNPNATHQLYADSGFTQPIDDFTLQGGYAGTGFSKDVWLCVTSADGTVTRYTRIEIRSWQDIQMIDGIVPIFLGALDPTVAQSSKNPMCLEISLPSDTALNNLISLPRGNGELLGKYPNISYTTYDDGNDEPALVIQNKSITVGSSVPDGYDAYYQVSVWHEDSTKVFYQIQIKFSDSSSDEAETGILSPGGSGIHRTWTLTEKTGTAEDPDLIEIRANAAYFGTTTSRSASNLALLKNNRATVELYPDANFAAAPVTAFDLTGTFEGGHAKDMGLKITAPNGTSVRHYKVQIRSYQEILTIAGVTPTWLGQSNTSSGNAGSNPMALYVELPATQVNAFAVNTYPADIVNSLIAYDGQTISADAGAEPCWVKQSSYKTDASTGYAGYLKLAIANGNSRSYYTIWFGAAEQPEDPVITDLVVEPEGANNLRKSWTLTKNAGTTTEPDLISIRANAAYFNTTTARKLTDIAAVAAGAAGQMYSDSAFSNPIESFTMQGGSFSGGFRKTVYMKAEVGSTARYYRIEIGSFQDIQTIDGAVPVYDRTEKTSGTNAAANRMILTLSLPATTVDAIQVGKYPDVTYLMQDGNAPSAVSTNQGAWRTAASAVSAGWSSPSDGSANYAGAYKINITHGGSTCQYLVWVRSV